MPAGYRLRNFVRFRRRRRRQLTFYDQVLVQFLIFNDLILRIFSFCIQHENASVHMFDHMIEENDLHSTFQEENLNEQELKFIKALIEGKVLVEISYQQRCYHLCSVTEFSIKRQCFEISFLQVVKTNIIKKESMYISSTCNQKVRHLSYGEKFVV